MMDICLTMALPDSQHIMSARPLVFALLVLGVTCQNCKQQPALGNGNNQKFTFSFCTEKSGDALGFIVLDDTPGTTKYPRDKLCMAVPDSPTILDKEYVVNLQFLNDVGAEDDIHEGNPGLVYNVIDSANYDFVFFRLHLEDACYGFGYLVNGTIHYDYTMTDKCKGEHPRGRMWHDVKLHVIGRKTRVYLNQNLVVTIPHQFSNVVRSGPAILNGYKNRVFFRGFAIEAACQKGPSADELSGKEVNNGASGIGVNGIHQCLQGVGTVVLFILVVGTLGEYSI